MQNLQFFFEKSSLYKEVFSARKIVFGAQNPEKNAMATILSSLVDKIINDLSEKGVSYTRINNSQYNNVVERIRKFCNREGVRVIFENLGRADHTYRVRLRKNTWSEGVRR